LANVSKIMQRFLGKIFLNGERLGVSVSTQTTARHLITTIHRKATNKTKEQRDMIYDFLCPSGKFYSFYIIFIVLISFPGDHLA